MIVLDASAALAGLVGDGPARHVMAIEELHVPHLVDSELLHSLRRRAAAGEIDSGQASAALDRWMRLGVDRHSLAPHLERMWDLRHNVSAYDAGYVVVAETLGCALVTADARLARANGIRCAVTVVPR